MTKKYKFNYELGVLECEVYSVKMQEIIESEKEEISCKGAI